MAPQAPADWPPPTTHEEAAQLYAARLSLIAEPCHVSAWSKRPCPLRYEDMEMEHKAHQSPAATEQEHATMHIHQLDAEVLSLLSRLQITH